MMQRLRAWLWWACLFVMAAFDRTTPLGKIVLLPICIAVSAWSFVRLPWHRDQEERDRLNNLFGWLDDYPEPRKPGGFAHFCKNRLTEYTRHRAQLVSKMGAFLIVSLTLTAVVGWWV